MTDGSLLPFFNQPEMSVNVGSCGSLFYTVCVIFIVLCVYHSECFSESYNLSTDHVPGFQL